jgi:hypothetical protein
MSLITYVAGVDGCGITCYTTGKILGGESEERYERYERYERSLS